MKQNWDRFTDKVDGLELRWRALVFAGMAGSLAWGVMHFGISPLLEQQRSLTEQQEALTAVATGAQDDGRRDLADKINTLKQQMAQRNQGLNALITEEVSGQQMLRLLDQLLSKSQGLMLVKLEKVPPDMMLGLSVASTAASAPAAASSVAAAQPLPSISANKHALRITLRGNYFDLLDYLERVEQLPYKINWVNLDYTVEHHPTALMTLTLYTLGDTKSWLAI